MGVGHLSSIKCAENSVEKADFFFTEKKKNNSCAEGEIRNHIYKGRRERERNVILLGSLGAFYSPCLPLVQVPNYIPVGSRRHPYIIIVHLLFLFKFDVVSFYFLK